MHHTSNAPVNDEETKRRRDFVLELLDDRSMRMSNIVRIVGIILLVSPIFRAMPHVVLWAGAATLMLETFQYFCGYQTARAGFDDPEFRLHRNGSAIWYSLCVLAFYAKAIAAAVGVVAYVLYL